MFIIQKMDDGYLFHNKGNIILFDTPNDAGACLEAFHSYTMSRIMQEQGMNPEAIFNAQHTLSLLHILQAEFDLNSVKTVLFKDLINK